VSARPHLSPVIERVREAVAAHRPLELDYELDINGCFKWPVTIQYHYQPGTRQVWDCPATEANAQIVAIRSRRSGKDVMGELPVELVAALESDLASGGL
jgi:hypothetical protein